MTMARLEETRRSIHARGSYVPPHLRDVRVEVDSDEYDSDEESVDEGESYCDIYLSSRRLCFLMTPHTVLVLRRGTGKSQ